MICHNIFLTLEKGNNSTVSHRFVGIQKELPIEVRKNLRCYYCSKNEIVVDYCEETERNDQCNSIKKNTLSNIIGDVKYKKSPLDNVVIKTNFVYQRVH